MTKFSYLTLLATLFIFTGTCQAHTATKNHCSQKDAQAIRMAIKHYVDKNTALAPYRVLIASERCVSSYASAKVTPKKPVTDPATVYLHKIKNQWQVLSLGTYFDDEFLAKLPSELRH